MNKTGPIIVIEDDLDDQDILGEVFKELNYQNEIIFFGDSQEALDFLTITEVEPFIIFSDINMMKSIPYLFFTTVAEQKAVINAYSKSIQGFFIKPDEYGKLKRTIRIIIEYWQECVSPNYVK